MENKAHVTNKIAILAVFVILFSLFSSVLFATTKELDDAIFHDNYGAVAALLAKGEDPRNIKKFPYLPALKIRKLLLENPENKEKVLAPNIFLYLVLQAKCLVYDEVRKVYTIGNGFWAGLRGDLVKLALEKGAKLEQIGYSSVVDAVRKKQKLVTLEQRIIRSNLKLFWEKLPDLQKDEEAVDNDADKKQAIDNADRFAKAGGHCWGLSMFWLYSKWLQFTQPENNYGYTNDWFKATVKDIAAWDGEKELSEEQLRDFRRFFSTVDFFQQPGIYRKDLVQTKAESIMNVSMLNTDGKVLQEEFDKEYSPQTLEEFRALLKEKISDDKLVFIIISFPGGFRHCNGLYKHGETYYRYEPNDNMGEYQSTSIEKIAEIIFDKYCLFENKIKIELRIYDFKEAP